MKTIDFMTSTADFAHKEIGEQDYYYLKKFKKYFSRGNHILIRNSKSKADYLVRLIEDPEKIPESESHQKWYNQGYRAKYEVVHVDNEKTGKARQITKPEKKKLLESYEYKCPGITFHSNFADQDVSVKCNVELDKIGKAEFDHIEEFSSKGGLSIPENIQPLCKGCHEIKTALNTREVSLSLDRFYKRAD